MDVKAIRARSSEAIHLMGVNIPESLPLLDQDIQLRSTEVAVRRMLSLHAVAAYSYGFDRKAVINWLQREELDGELSPRERMFLHEGVGAPAIFRVQIESMWAFSWALNFVKNLDFMENCSNNFVMLLPDLRSCESSKRCKEKACLRSIEEIATSCDLAYCLHWLVRQAQLEGKVLLPNIQPYVIVERRRALEWLLGNEDWDNVSLDT